jgi:hypothetical protein
MGLTPQAFVENLLANEDYVISAPGNPVSARRPNPNAMPRAGAAVALRASTGGEGGRALAALPPATITGLPGYPWRPCAFTSRWQTIPQKRFLLLSFHGRIRFHA